MRFERKDFRVAHVIHPLRELEAKAGADLIYALQTSGIWTPLERLEWLERQRKAAPAFIGTYRALLTAKKVRLAIEAERASKSDQVAVVGSSGDKTE